MRYNEHLKGSLEKGREGPHEQNVNEGGLFKEIQDQCLS